MRFARRTAPTLFLVALAACSSSGSDENSADNDDTGATTTAATTTAETSAPKPTDPPTTTEAPAPEPAEAPTTAAGPTTTAPEPEPWAPVEAGPYSVGATTVTLDDPAGDRPLTVEVWFPIDDTIDATALTPQQYTFLPGITYPSPGALAASADQIEDDSRFPLIVYSHGSSGLRFIHSSYTEALASHGYVVVAADHTGNTLLDDVAGTQAPGSEIALARPTDVRRLIDAFSDPSDPVAGPFAAQVDAEQVVVTGHSLGGFTALAMLTGYTNELGESATDERVDTIVLLAPAVSSTWFTDERLAEVDVPMMALVGTNDTSTPADPNVTRLWEFTTGVPAYQVELIDGVHLTFTDLCAYIDYFSTIEDLPAIVNDTIADFAGDSCAPGTLDDERAGDLTNTYVVQFLDEVLHGGPAIDPTLVATPNDVIFSAR